jgi:uncharacterized protein
MKIGGYAVLWDDETRIEEGFGPFREVFRRGAFARALREKQDTVCWYQHGTGAPLPLGRTTSGTLTLQEDGKGLAFLCELPPTQAATDLAASVERGDVHQMSFAFRVAPSGRERWTDHPGKPPLREVLDADLTDVSPVVFPAYASTSVGVRRDPGKDHRADLELLKARIEIERLR